MDFPPPPPPLCLPSEVFSLRLFFPATVLTPSLAADASGLADPLPGLTPVLVQVHRKPPHPSPASSTTCWYSPSSDAPTPPHEESGGDLL